MKKYIITFLLFLGLMFSMKNITYADVKESTITLVSDGNKNNQTWTCNTYYTNYIALKEGGANHGRNYTLSDGSINLKITKDSNVATGAVLTVKANKDVVKNKTFYIYDKNDKLKRKINVYLKNYPKLYGLTANKTVLFAGENTGLSLSVGGYITGYSWTKNNNNVDLYNTDKKNASYTGRYAGSTYIVGNAICKTNGGTITLNKGITVNVKALPTITNITNQFESKGILHSKDVFLYSGDSATVSSYISGGNNNSYLYTASGLILKDERNSTATIIAPMVNKRTEYSLTFTVTANLNGTVRKASRTIKVIVLPKPIINLCSLDGNNLSFYEMKSNNSLDIMTTLTNFPSDSSIIYKVITDNNLIQTTNISNGRYKLSTTKDFISGKRAYVHIEATIYSGNNIGDEVSKNNGDYIIRSGKLLIAYKGDHVVYNPNDNSINAPKLKIRNKKKGIKISWSKVENAVGYKLYRKVGKKGDWNLLSSSNKLSYFDKKVKYKKKYTYKIAAYNNAVTGIDSMKTIKRRLLKPRIKKITKSSGGYRITIKGAKYSGYIIYSGKNKKTKNKIAMINSKNGTIFLKKGINYIRVRSYKKIGRKYIYSKLSKVKKIKVK